jgi:hypothetical protein
MEIRGGERMKSVLDGIAAKAPSMVVQVGFLEGSTEADGTSVPLIAAVQNFGAPSRGIPPRPFFSNMIAKNKASWTPAIKERLEVRRGDAKEALQDMGETIKGQLQQSILDTNTPPLKPATIARKGFSKPLIDTSTMINSVDWRIKK